MPGFPIEVPDNIDEQRAIAHILGTLDDKIELNRRMNETLEAMARALFKSWFVDFDPVRAKVADLIKDGLIEIGDGYRAKNSELGKPGLPSFGQAISAAALIRGEQTSYAKTAWTRPAAN
jgi:restriction endonuclease S subunit